MNRKNSTYKKILIILLVLFQLQTLAGYSISLYMEEFVPINESITLGALVSVKDAPSYIKKQIEEYPLPLLHEKIHLIPSQYIRDLISGFTQKSVIISGTKTTLFPRDLIETFGKEFITSLSNYLISTLCKKNNRVEIDIVSFPLFLPGVSGHEYSFRSRNIQEYLGFPLGKINVYIDVKTKDEYEEQVMSLNVHQFIPMVQAKETLERNEELSREKLIITEQELNPFQGVPLLPSENITTYQSIKKINTGDIIYRSSVKKALKVQAGEKVTIFLRKGLILLSMIGRAGESGSIGDLIKVQPTLSSSWIIAQVTGKQEVCVDK